jgi:hypothetical protein
MKASEVIQIAKDRQIDRTTREVDYAVYYGKEHDLLIALPHSENLIKNFKIYFSKKQSEYCIATIYAGAHVYKVLFNDKQLLFNERGYHCIMGRFPTQKGLHKQPLYRLAYTAFYGQPEPGYHIHHIDKNKHNNSMNNLVALSEGEHSLIHGRDLSVGRTLFNAPTPKTLLSELLKDSLSQRKEAEEQTLLEYKTDEELEKRIEPSLLEILLSEATEVNIKKAISMIDTKENTVIAELVKNHNSKK